jgi:hypothetical protein
MTEHRSLLHAAVTALVLIALLPLAAFAVDKRRLRSLISRAAR